MNKFDTRSMKFLGILIAICVVFLIVIGNAFRYLPDYASNAPKNLQDIEKNTSVQKNDSVDSSIDEEQEEDNELEMLNLEQLLPTVEERGTVGMSSYGMMS